MRTILKVRQAIIRLYLIYVVNFVTANPRKRAENQAVHRIMLWLAFGVIQSHPTIAMYSYFLCEYSRLFLLLAAALCVAFSA
jgi:hypothetical protein